MNAGSPAFPRRYVYQLSFTAEGPPGSTATARSEPLAIEGFKMERLHVAPQEGHEHVADLRALPAGADVRRIGFCPYHGSRWRSCCFWWVAAKRNKR